VNALGVAMDFRVLARQQTRDELAVEHHVVLVCVTTDCQRTQRPRLGQRDLVGE
jgi:hypothetical protein